MTTRTIDTDNLVGGKEIAARLKVSRTTVFNWMARYQFPEPLATLSSGRVYDWEDIEAWLRDNGIAEQYGL